MNYLKELNAFLDQLEMEELSLSASMLWISLMHFNNKVGWRKEFAVPSPTLMTKARLTESSFKRARTELKEKGYIKHTFVNRNRAPLYEMISRVNQVETEAVAESMNAGVSAGTDAGLGALFKRKERKRKEADEGTASKLNPHDFYQQNIGLLSPFIAERITYWCTEMSDELVIESMRRALQRNKRFFNYCEAILSRWQSAGVTSLESALSLEQSSNQKKSAEKEYDIFEEIRKERNL
ncbi:DnaD domain protein [Halobacillus salinarum]|uniref:DnaD domain protein n=1 Tax=Halobacillus salinarum TaxID=2932257 RepID=A0ABY4ERU2_9BACI|nr:DnaD domain protein [Halobacillus salinarum]UOQ44846.1 DnaD domain protein [Halobacillus salinarum]